MRLSAGCDTEMLLAVAQKVIEVLPALPSLHCALDLISQRLADPPLPCWTLNKHQTSCIIADWQGGNGPVHCGWSGIVQEWHSCKWA